VGQMVTAWAAELEDKPEIFKVIKGLKECDEQEIRTGLLESLFKRQDNIDGNRTVLSKRYGQVARFWHLIERDAARRATIFTSVRSMSVYFGCNFSVYFGFNFIFF
jgi:hypothetical protein